MNDNNQNSKFQPSDTNGDMQGTVNVDNRFNQAPIYQEAQQAGFHEPQLQYNQQQVPYNQPLNYVQPPNYSQNQAPNHAPQPNYGSQGYNFPPYPYTQMNTKDPYPFVPPTPILYTGQPPIQPKKKLSAGTFLIPLGFMALHMLVLTIVTALIMVVSSFSNFSMASGMEEMQEQMLKQAGSAQIYALLIAMPILIGLYLLAAHLLKRRGNPYVYFSKPPTGDMLRAIVIGMGCLGVANLIMMLFRELSTSSSFIEKQYNSYLQMTGSMNLDINLFILILTLVILVPIAEELLFRGLIAGEFRRAMPDWLNIVINGLLFSLFHMNFVQSAYVLLAGLALAAVGLWSRSIWVPILLHAVYNFFGSVALVLVGDNEELHGLLFIIQLVCIVIGIFFAVWSYYRRKKEVLMVHP